MAKKIVFKASKPNQSLVVKKPSHKNLDRFRPVLFIRSNAKESLEPFQTEPHEKLLEKTKKRTWNYIVEGKAISPTTMHNKKKGRALSSNVTGWHGVPNTHPAKPCA